MQTFLHVRRVATCKPGKPGLTSFSKTLALLFIQFLSFRKMKAQERQNVNPGLPEKSGWLRACMLYSIVKETVASDVYCLVFLLFCHASVKISIIEFGIKWH